MRNKIQVSVNSGVLFWWVFFYIVDFKLQVNNMYRESIFQVFYPLKGKQEQAINSCMYAILRLPLKNQSFCAKLKS